MNSKGAFKWSGKKDIKEAIIPYGFSEIDSYAFCKCSSLTNIKNNLI